MRIPRIRWVMRGQALGVVLLVLGYLIYLGINSESQAKFRLVMSGYNTPSNTPTPPPSCLHSPRGFGCGTSPVLRAGFLTYLGTAGDNSAALASEFSTASSANKDVLIGPAQAVITVSPATGVNLPANINVQCASGVVLDESAATSTSYVGFNLIHSGSDGGSFSNCIVRGHNWNINPPTAISPNGNGPWLMYHDGTSAPVNGYTVINNYFNGAGGQCATEWYTSNNTVGSQNIVENYNTFDQCELYGFCTSGTTNHTFAHNYSASCSGGNENNNGTQPYTNATYTDNEFHFGVGTGCYNFTGTPSHCGNSVACHTVYFQTCGSDNSPAITTAATSIASSNIFNGDGTCFQVIPSGGSAGCSPQPQMSGNSLINGATCQNGTC